MSWKKSDITTPIDSTVAAAINPISNFVSAVSPVLSAISALLNAAKAFVLTTEDKIAISIIGSLVNELTKLNNDLFGTGIYMLNVGAYDIEGYKLKFDSIGFPLLPTDTALRVAIESFDDVGDNGETIDSQGNVVKVNPYSGRPQFSDESQVSALGLLATAPSLGELITLMGSLINVFGIPDWKFAHGQYTEFKSKGVNSIKPDWRSIKLNSFEPFTGLQREINKMINTLKGNQTSVKTNLSDLIDIIQSKVSTVQDIINNINAIINNLNHCSGLYVLDLPLGVGGNERIKSAIADASLQSVCSLSINKYTYLTIFVGGGPSATIVDNLRKSIIV